MTTTTLHGHNCGCPPCFAKKMIVPTDCRCPAVEWDGDDYRCQCCGGVFKCWHPVTR